MRNKLITLSYMFKGDPIKIQKAVKSNLEVHVNTKFISMLEQNNIGVITILDDDYPNQFKELFDPPIVIYYLGNKSLLNTKMFAIIGSRGNSYYSEMACKGLVEELESDVTIVSGLARGIDCLAHENAIKCSKKTIAVLGSGFNNIYPKSNTELAKKIGANHLLISEYPPNIKASKSNFPLRNRIIASLSERIYVIEAREKSGSIITANIGLDLGKDIYCIPGSVFDNSYAGSHKLINDGANLFSFKNGE